MKYRGLTRLNTLKAGDLKEIKGEYYITKEIHDSYIKYRIDKRTLSQSTRYKTKGKEVYEGDIFFYENDLYKVTKHDKEYALENTKYKEKRMQLKEVDKMIKVGTVAEDMTTIG